MSNTLAPVAALRFGERREILITSGFGAGWSTCNPECQKEMLYDAEIIAFLKGGGKLHHGHPLLAKYADRACTLGARDLIVTTAATPFRVTEYDGREGVEEFNPARWEF